MPHQTPLSPGDPRGVGRYRVAGRMIGIPSDDPIYVGTGPDGTEVAISILRGDWARDGAARDRFAAEATVAKRVPPFCAARVLDAGLDGADAYLVSEFVPGPSLLEVVAAEGVRRGHDLEAIAIGMVTGLASVHQAGLVHGSFGPEYVVLSTADGSPRVVEFGITPPYGTATPSADMLAWGQTVVFAASGRPPVTLGDLDVLPGHLREPVERCLDPEPSQRPAARAVVLGLLGGGNVPAGLLAEGSRRAARPASRSVADELAAGPRHTGPHSSPARQPRSAPAQNQHGQNQHGQSRAAQRGGPVRSGRSHGGGARSAEAGRGRRIGLIAAAAVVMLALAGVLAMHVLGGTKPRDSGTSSAVGTAATSPPASPSASPSPSAGPSTPAGFAGTWSGQVEQPPTDTYQVSVKLAAGASSGQVTYSGPDLTCSGQLNLVTATGRKLTMTQGIVQGQSSCENGDVTIDLTGGGRSIWFSFRSDGYTAAGTLTRQS